MVEHGEADGSVERRGGEGHGGRILTDYTDVVAGLAAAKILGERGVHLHTGELTDAGSQEISGGTGAGTDFEDVAAEAQVLQGPRENIGLDGVFPARRIAEPAMREVHVVLC